MTTSPIAYRWRSSALQPVAHVDLPSMDGLLHIERQRDALVQNTAQFVAGHPANHALLTGARGTGKSTLVKALLPMFAAKSLRLVEVHPADLVDLPDIVAPLRRRSERFVLFVDDFSVTSDDRALSALKTALDGGIEEPAENVLLYATSNRRYLLPTHTKDNREFVWEDGEIHPGESTEEKISLSERFGLWLSFSGFSQPQYLRAVRLHLEALGAEYNEKAEAQALSFALLRASRSGRVARQFARQWAGALALKNR